MAGMKETEVRPDGWCEGGLRLQRNDGKGCATMRVISERVKSPGAYVTMSFTRPYLLSPAFVLSDHPSVL